MIQQKKDLSTVPIGTRIKIKSPHNKRQDWILELERDARGWLVVDNNRIDTTWPIPGEIVHKDYPFYPAFEIVTKSEEFYNLYEKLQA